jgi:hypothetical protein
VTLKVILLATSIRSPTVWHCRVARRLLLETMARTGHPACSHISGLLWRDNGDLLMQNLNFALSLLKSSRTPKHDGTDPVRLRC